MQVVHFCGMEMPQPRGEGVLVDPQLLGGLGERASPGKRFAEIPDADQLAGRGTIDGGLLTRRKHRVGGHWASPDVLDLVGHRATSLSLQQPVVEGDRSGVEVRNAEQIGREAGPEQGPVGESAELVPGIVHAHQPAGTL